MTTAEKRAAMVVRLQAHGITGPRVLAAMSELPRERFTPTADVSEAYEDVPLNIGFGQTISAPWIVAFSVAALELDPTADVLEIGTGSGYGAAVLSRCFRSVVTIERHAGLAARARNALIATGCANVEVRTGDGSEGAPDRAPFDGIVVTAMAAREPPPALLEQLSPNGTMICPVGHHRRGVLMRYRHDRAEELADVAFVPLVTAHRRDT